MKVSEEFLIAKKNKFKSGFLIQQAPHMYEGNPYMRLAIDVPIKGTNKVASTYIDTPIQLSIDNYSSDHPTSYFAKADVNYVSFQESLYDYEFCHIDTFLSFIKKDSEVSFKLIAYNGNSNYAENKQINHKMYGLIDGKKFLLWNYTGKQNSASPVRHSQF